MTIGGPENSSNTSAGWVGAVTTTDAELLPLPGVELKMPNIRPYRISNNTVMRGRTWAGFSVFKCSVRTSPVNFFGDLDASLLFVRNVLLVRTVEFEFAELGLLDGADRVIEEDVTERPTGLAGATPRTGEWD
jgi:hypothetical protein